MDARVAPPTGFDNANRYVDCGNGPVTDTVTGLIWLQDANCAALGSSGGATYATANQAAAALAEGTCGLTDGSRPGDWRLATRGEWVATIARAVALERTIYGANSPPSLTNDAGTACYGDGSSSSFAGVASGYYSSSSSIENFPSLAWGATLGFGGVSFTDNFGTLRVWPVRGGP